MATSATALRQRPSTRPAPSAYNHRRWKAASRAFRARLENVWCIECRKHNRLRRATQTDHIIPHNGDETLFWTESNWQPLCDRCHARKTRQQQYQGG